MKDFRQILVETEMSEEELEESSGAMYAIKGLMDKWKRTPSKTEKQKLADEMKTHEAKLDKSPYWKTATIGKEYEKFKKDLALGIDY